MLLPGFMFIYGYYRSTTFYNRISPSHGGNTVWGNVEQNFKQCTAYLLDFKE